MIATESRNKASQGAIDRASLSEMNLLATKFNDGQLAESEQLAIRLTQSYPSDGFGWKVLGAILQQQGLITEAGEALKKAAVYLPQDSEAQYNLGNFYYDQQQLDAAATHYKNAIKLAPTFAKAHYNLGNVLKSQNELDQAKISYNNALKIDSQNVHATCNLAQVFYEQELFSDAIIYYKQALQVQVDFAAAYIGLGASLQAIGQLPEAEQNFRQAIMINPNDVDAHQNLGGLLKALGRLEEAESSYRTALTISPENADAYTKLGSILKSMGKTAEASDCFSKALSINPMLEEVQNDIGLALADQGRFSEAEACYQKAIEIAPVFWKAYNNLGLALYGMARFKEAEAAFETAIDLNPYEALIHSNLSLPLVAQGQIKKAEVSLKYAIEISPGYVNAYINLGTNYLAQGLAQEAEAAFVEALKIDQDSTKARSNLLFTLNYSGRHSAEFRLDQASQYGQIADKNSSVVFTEWQDKLQAKRLKIGLVSGDLRQHPVAYFLENWAKHIDFSRFELIAYPTDLREDEFTDRLKPYFSGWKSLVGLTDQAAAELIHGDGVHILMDLSGHTAENRLPVFARKPAPIQVSWLGYFATTGMSTMDYFIADEVGVPEQNKTQFVEKIKYLADTRLCFTAPHNSIEVSNLPALKNGYITFGSFQTMVKASDEVLSLWAEVIKSTPNSKLRWQCKSLGDSAIVEDLRQRFAKYGIGSEQLILLESVSRNEYLKAHAEVDLILDTFPYPGGTTTCEGLWMGVPTLTLAGDTLIARQGASMLTAAGLADWVAEDKSDYVNKALSCCADLTKLAKLRAGMRAKVIASPLFDGQRFAKNMEKAILEMWDEYSKNSLYFQVAVNIPASHMQDANAFMAPQKLAIEIVSATRYSEADFWTKSALGLSLKRHLKQDARLSAKISFENTRGLSEVFNAAIDQADTDATMVFIHDDVWIDEANFAEVVAEGLEHFDIIGIAGNKRRLPNQPGWVIVDLNFKWDEQVNLSGQVAHSKSAFGAAKVFGEAPATCELLDGVFLAVKKSSLDNKGARFDEQFDFHFYDLDFCRTAKQAGLTLGTWHIQLTHQSIGQYGTKQWHEKYHLYLNKWEESGIQKVKIPENSEPNQNNQALQQAIEDVVDIALEHQRAGRLEQAEQFYHEIISISANHAAANHNLGVIKAGFKNVQEALPYLEIAVQEKPDIEQYWVTYIDALMQSGAIDTAAEALELGQKFGLRPGVAKMLAADFVKQFDARENKLQSLRNQALDALQVELRPRAVIRANANKNAGKPVFYIWSPDYTEYSSGIKALHLLCDRLNNLGYEAYISSAKVNELINTPKITSYLISQHKQQNRLQIAIYPETHVGNPLLIPNVVRYLLNKPNFFLKTSWFGSYHKDEKILHYDDSFAIPWIKSDCVRVQTIDRNTFKLAENSNIERSGFLVYSHRVEPDLTLIPDWCKPFQVISMENPRSAKELSTMYQQSSGLIVFERTAAIVEAIFCGCPVIASSQYGFKDFSIYDQAVDIAWDFDLSSYERAKQSIPLFPKIYDANEYVDTQALLVAVKDIVHHFQFDELDAPEFNHSVIFEQAKKNLQLGMVTDSIIAFRQLILDNPQSVDVYFYLAQELMALNLAKPAQETLLNGELYLEKLPEHESLNAIREIYYQLLSAACRGVGDLVLSNQYIEKSGQYQ